MKKKILISTVVIIMILSMSIMLFAGCNFDFGETELVDFEIPEAYIGATMPTDGMVNGGIKAIDKNMNGFEMLQVGMENFYKANYAIIEYNGGVDMYMKGIGNVNQVVQSTKIRKGIGDANGNNANNATYFADNKSHSNFAQIYERFLITPDSYTRRAGRKKIDYKKPSDKYGRLGAWSVGEWSDPQDYETLNALVEANSNNPTILWMYTLDKDYIIDKMAPIYDDESKTYRFSFKFEPVKSTEEYIKVMQVQLQSNAGKEVRGLEFVELVLEVVMWENGMIRAINVTEQYQMSMMLTSVVPLDSKVKLTATQLFSYDPEEELYKIDELTAKFNNNAI